MVAAINDAQKHVLIRLRHKNWASYCYPCFQTWPNLTSADRSKVKVRKSEPYRETDVLSEADGTYGLHPYLANSTLLAAAHLRNSMASIFLDHAIEYDGTGVRLADVLPVPRCKLPLQPRLDRRSTTAAFQTSRRPGGSSYSPLEYLRRQEAREQDQEPPKSLGTVCAELILQAFAPGLLLSMTVRATFRMQQ